MDSSVSVVIPIYNAAPWLSQAIDSALAQGEVVREVILVDNNSTDDCPEIIASYRQRYPARIITQRVDDQGCSSARNAGWRIARGQWIQFLDADDWLLPNKIARQLARIEDGVEWIIGAYRHHYANGETEECLPNPDPWRGLAHGFAIGNTNANLYHCNALERIGGWRTDLPDNTDPQLHFDLLRAGVPYRFDPTVGSIYRHHRQERVTTRVPIGRLGRKADISLAIRVYLLEEKPTYWRQNAAWFNAAALYNLRMLATYDLDAATTRYNTHFPDFPPELDHRVVSGIVRWYAVFGFRHVEALRIQLAGYLPKNLSRSIKRLLP